MKYTVEAVKKYIELLGYYKDIDFVEEQEGDCVYFDAINPDGIFVSIRADVEYEVGIEEWNFYECCDEWDWSNINSIYI